MKLELNEKIDTNNIDNLIKEQINEYNNLLTETSNKILALRIDKYYKDWKVEDVYEINNNLSVINSAKARKETSKALEKLIYLFGVWLREERDRLNQEGK